MKARMWEWWRKVEQEYREKRRQEDQQRERERRERTRRRTPYEAEQEARKYASAPLEELIAYMEREWGVEVDWEELGVTRPRPRGIQVEVNIGKEREDKATTIEERRSQKSGSEGLMRKALVMVLTGRWTN